MCLLYCIMNLIMHTHVGKMIKNPLSILVLFLTVVFFSRKCTARKAPRQTYAYSRCCRHLSSESPSSRVHTGRTARLLRPVYTCTGAWPGHTSDPTNRDCCTDRNLKQTAVGRRCINETIKHCGSDLSGIQGTLPNGKRLKSGAGHPFGLVFIS